MCSLLFGDREESMRILSEEEISRFADELVQWKKSTVATWEHIAEHMFFISAIDEFRSSDEESYLFYRYKILDVAKQKIFEEQKKNSRNGISAWHEKWCWLENLYHPYQWETFQKQMSNWSPARMDLVSHQSLDIVNYLSNPLKLDTPSLDASRKGLVYGNVQAGKTAHIAATIAMYASAGCNMIIVLSGVTKSLRLQTQDRLRHDLGIDDYSCYDLLTANTDLLGKREVKLEGRLQGGKPCIGVFKKSPSALRRLLGYCQSPNDVHFWDKRMVLIIDDESDQYSLNVKKMRDDESEEEFDRSTTNKLIVQLLNLFPRYSYIGFTATPFANVLNEKPGKNSLYPKDFIYPLAVNSNYYGAKKLFGSADDDPEKPLKVMNAINIIEDEDVDPRDNPFDKAPDSLQEAILYFLVATACKAVRGFKDNSSMLIHLDSKIATHERLRECVEKYCNRVKSHYPEYRLEMQEVWDKEKDRNPFGKICELFEYNPSDKTKYLVPNFSDLEPALGVVLQNLKIVVDNSVRPMEERLHYNPHGGDVVIVIGGNTLSRGLTLEGLVVSYFFRTTKMYDSLLQMGRWFGYRIGYEDLPRLYTTSEIIYKFSELADVEEELREQLEGYSFDVTPSDVAVKIRTLPQMQITRKNAMQSAVSTGANLAGHRPSTLFFPRKDSAWLKHNQKVTGRFLDDLDTEPTQMNGAFVFKNVPIDKVANYVQEMNISPEDGSCNKELVLRFMHKADEHGYLRKWNVAVVSNESGVPYQISRTLCVHLITRSRMDMKDDSDMRAYLHVLQQPDSMLLDTDAWGTTKANVSVPEKFRLRHQYFEKKGEEEPGLLVIYPINKDSLPKKGSDRLPLDAVEHIIGLSFVFPAYTDKKLDKYMTIDLENLKQR